MKTALQTLIEWADDYYELNKAAPNLYTLKKKATELLEAEKRQIVEAYKNGFSEGKKDTLKIGHDYFNQTYKK